MSFRRVKKIMGMNMWGGESIGLTFSIGLITGLLFGLITKNYLLGIMGGLIVFVISTIWIVKKNVGYPKKKMKKSNL